MVKLSVFKKEIENRITQDYKVAFLGGRDTFENIVGKLSDAQATNIYDWIDHILKKEVLPLRVSTSKKYKQWMIRDLLPFNKRMQIDGVAYRIIFIKVKNSFYIEFHLGDHKYYDKLRYKLHLTEKKYK